MTSGSHHVSSPLVGIGLKIVSVAFFVGMQTCIKASGQLPAGQIVFFRSFFAIIPIIIFLAYRKELGTALHTARPLSQIVRGLVGVSAMGLGFFALTRLPLPEAVTLGYAQPLLVVVFSALFLGEVIRTYRWSAVCVGLIGIAIISWPTLTLFRSGSALGDEEFIGVLAVLVSAAISAVAVLLVRDLVRTERAATIVLWFSLTASGMALFSIPFGWQAMNTPQVLLLIMSGIFGGLGQILMTTAYRHAEASTVAPFEYTSMILAITIGYLAFGNIPTLYTLVGGTIVIGAGVFIVWRERQLGIERQAVVKATTPE